MWWDNKSSEEQTKLTILVQTSWSLLKRHSWLVSSYLNAKSNCVDTLFIEFRCNHDIRYSRGLGQDSNCTQKPAISEMALKSQKTIHKESLIWIRERLLREYIKLKTFSWLKENSDCHQTVQVNGKVREKKFRPDKHLRDWQCLQTGKA